MEPPGAATYRFACAASPWPVAATVDERAPSPARAAWARGRFRGGT